MRTLIHNYASPITTEPMYLAKSLEIVGTPVSLWNSQTVSAFDMFDSFQPDIFIGHFRYLTNDVIKYMTSTNRKISMVLNITGATEQDIQTLETIQQEQKLDIPFVFVNVPDAIPHPKSLKIKTVNLLPAADIFIPKQNVVNFNIDCAVVGTSMGEAVEDAIKNKKTYHLLNMSEQQNEAFDAQITLQDLINISSNYEEIILAGGVDLILSQATFDAALHAKKLSLKTDKESQHIVDKFLASLFHDEGKNEELGNLIKGQVKRKHTCISRAARLCKFLKNDTAKIQLEKMRDEL